MIIIRMKIYFHVLPLCKKVKGDVALETMKTNQNKTRKCKKNESSIKY